MTQKNRGHERTGAPSVLPYIQDIRMEIKYYRGGYMGVTLFGCSGFVAYSHECVIMRLNRRVVKMTGRELWCRMYGNRTAEIIGMIEGMSFAGEGI